jgi:hypothetical protein
MYQLPTFKIRWVLNVADRPGSQADFFSALLQLRREPGTSLSSLGVSATGRHAREVSASIGGYAKESSLEKGR